MDPKQLRDLMEAYQQVHAQDIEELYKGKHGQTEKEYQDSRSDAGKMVSGDSKRSGAAYSSRAIKNTGPNPAGGSKKPQGQGRMTRGARIDLEYRKANLKKEEVEVAEAKADAGLTPLQKIRKRNKAYAMPGEKAGEQTSNRRAERSSARGEKKERGAKSAFGTMRHVGGPYKEEVEAVDEKFSMAADPSKPESPRPTRKAENKKGMSLRSRAVKAVGTQTRQDKETGIREDKREELEATGIFTAEEIERILEIMAE